MTTALRAGLGYARRRLYSAQHFENLLCAGTNRIRESRRWDFVLFTRDGKRFVVWKQPDGDWFETEVVGFFYLDTRHGTFKVCESGKFKKLP
jgi:hypothetical protein